MPQKYPAAAPNNIMNLNGGCHCLNSVVAALSSTKHKFPTVHYRPPLCLPPGVQGIHTYIYRNQSAATEMPTLLPLVTIYSHCYATTCDIILVPP